jgi:hypothetical protein
MMRVCTILLIAAGLGFTACSNGGGGGSSPSPLPPQPPPSGGWAFTGSLNTARDSHTATVLTLGPNAGKVLVAGGTNGPTIFTSIELYNPVTGTWSFANPMNVPRRNHTATLLPNGKILVTGGFTTNTTVTNTAEVYDPTNGSWTFTNTPMSIARTYHTATLLPSGKVLVAAGTANATTTSPGFSLATAEV